MCWCISSSEIYGPSMSLSDSVLVQQVCVSIWALLLSTEVRGEILTRTQCVPAYVVTGYFEMYLISASTLTGTVVLGGNTLQVCTKMTRKISMNLYVRFKYLMQDNQTQKYYPGSQLRVYHLLQG